MSNFARIRRVDRRAFLSGAGAAIGLPLLEAMGCDRSAPLIRAGAPALVRAAERAPVQRFIGILNNNGRVADDWYPTGDETNFSLGPIMKSLEPYQQDLIVFQGLDNKAAEQGLTDGHHEGVVSMLTGTGIHGETAADGAAGGISLDQTIALAIGASNKRPSMVFATDAEAGNFNALSWDEHLQQIPRLVSPAEMFRLLFGDSTLTPDALAAQLARRRSILDDVQSDYQKLLGKVSSADRMRLEAHLDSVRQVESKLSIPVSCPRPPPPAKEGDNQDGLPDLIRSQMDLFVLALSCDITRVATFTFRHPGAGQSYHSWLGLPGDAQNEVVNEHHEMSHYDVENRDNLLVISDWYMRQTAYLIGKLKTTADGPGTLFDGTLIFQGSDVAEGPAHSKTNMPYFLAGTAGGYFKAGRFLKYQGASHNDLLVSIMNAFGIAGTSFGDPSVCTGPLAGLG